MRYRFGLFEFDDAELALRRERSVVRLQSQPARVLACLVKNPERIVSRNEIQKCLWGDSTFVDFDRGLNFCIAQIRSALSDDSSNPRFIRTIPKIGYQFIAPLEIVEEPIDNDSDVVPHAVRRLRVPLTAVALLLLVAVAFVAGYQLHGRAKVTQIPVVAVARFDNETTNPELTAFADRLADDLVAQLADRGQRQFLVIGNAHILRVPRDQRDLSAIGVQLNAKYIVLGQVTNAADRTRILIHLIRLPEQTHLWVERIEGSTLSGNTDQSHMADQISGAFVPRLVSDIHSEYSSPGLGR